jgi:hypothetical protein
VNKTSPSWLGKEVSFLLIFKPSVFALRNFQQKQKYREYVAIRTGIIKKILYLSNLTSDFFVLSNTFIWNSPFVTIDFNKEYKALFFCAELFM